MSENSEHGIPQAQEEDDNCHHCEGINRILLERLRHPELHRRPELRLKLLRQCCGNRQPARQQVFRFINRAPDLFREKISGKNKSWSSSWRRYRILLTALGELLVIGRALG